MDFRIEFLKAKEKSKKHNKKHFRLSASHWELITCFFRNRQPKTYRDLHQWMYGNGTEQNNSNSEQNNSNYRQLKRLTRALRFWKLIRAIPDGSSTLFFLDSGLPIVLWWGDSNVTIYPPGGVTQMSPCAFFENASLLYRVNKLTIKKVNQKRIEATIDSTTDAVSLDKLTIKKVNQKRIEATIDSTTVCTSVNHSHTSRIAEDTSKTLVVGQSDKSHASFPTIVRRRIRASERLQIKMDKSPEELAKATTTKDMEPNKFVPTRGAEFQKMITNTWNNCWQSFAADINERPKLPGSIGTRLVSGAPVLHQIKSKKEKRTWSELGAQYSVDDLQCAVRGYFLDSWYLRNKYWGLWHVLRNDANITKFAQRYDDWHEQPPTDDEIEKLKNVVRVCCKHDYIAESVGVFALTETGIDLQTCLESSTYQKMDSCHVAGYQWRPVWDLYRACNVPVLDVFISQLIASHRWYRTGRRWFDFRYVKQAVDQVAFMTPENYKSIRASFTKEFTPNSVALSRLDRHDCDDESAAVYDYLAFWMTINSDYKPSNSEFAKWASVDLKSADTFLKDFR